MSDLQTAGSSLHDHPPRPRAGRCSPLVAVAMMAALLGACSNTVEYYPPDAALRARLGDVAVVSTASSANVTAVPPDAITGAGKGAGIAAGAAGMGTLAGAWSLTGKCFEGTDGSGKGGGFLVALFFCPFIGVAGTALAVPAALGGAVYGAAAASSEEEVKAADDALHAVTADFTPDEALLKRFLAAAREQTELPIHDVTESEKPTKNSSDQPYRDYAAAGIDTVVELGAARIGLIGSGRFRPRLRYEITFDAELIRTDDGTTMYSRGWKYISPAMRYLRVTANRASELRDSIEAALGKMTGKAVSDLFITTEKERKGLTAQPVATVFTTYASKSEIKKSAVATVFTTYASKSEIKKPVSDDPPPEDVAEPQAIPTAPEDPRDCDYPDGSYDRNDCTG